MPVKARSKTVIMLAMKTPLNLNRVALLAIALLIGAGFWWSSQSPSPKNQKDEIIGTWRNDKGQTSQFFSNGELTGTAASNHVVKARYQWMTDKHIKVTSVAPRAGIEVIQKVEITGDTMKITFEDGKVEIWQRIKGS